MYVIHCSEDDVYFALEYHKNIVKFDRKKVGQIPCYQTLNVNNFIYHDYSSEISITKIGFRTCHGHREMVHTGYYVFTQFRKMLP